MTHGPDADRDDPDPPGSPGASRPSVGGPGPPRPGPRKADVTGLAPPPFINLCGDYRFLRGGYWALVDAELGGVRSRPTPLEAATAQNAAACLLVAAQAGLATPPWTVAARDDDVEPPCVLVPVAGLTDASYQVLKGRSATSQWRRASQNGTRPVLSVSLPGRLRSLKMILGLTTHDDYQLAWEVWRVFGVPLATVWFVEPAPGRTSRDGATGDERPQDEGRASGSLFIGLDPLPLHELTERELRMLEEVSQRPMSHS